jgi:hypothetical protein
MNYTEKEALFISNLQSKIGDNTLHITDKTQFMYSDSFYNLTLEMMYALDYFSDTRYKYVDENHNPVNSEKCLLEPDKLTKLIDFLKHRYKLNNIPYINFPKKNFNLILQEGCCGTVLPAGGGPGFFLTKNSTGQLVWRRINLFEYQQAFTYTSGPYTFTLNIVPDDISQVFVNGQLFNKEVDYTLSGSTVIILAPNELFPGAEVIIFAKYGTLTLSSGVSQHDDLDGIKGSGTYHVSEAEWEAINGANSPSGSNVFATMADVSVRDDNAVHYDTADGKNNTEKAQARDNISVYSILEINNITGDLTDLNTSDKDNLVVGINQANSWKIIEW